MLDEFGIVSRRAEDRAVYGNRLSHGTIRDRAAPAVPPAAPARPPVVKRPEPPPPPPPPPPKPVARSVSVGDVLDAVSEAWGVSREDILSRHQGRKIMPARKAAIRLLRRRTPMSLPAIAKAMCRAHSIVVRSLRLAEALHAAYPDWRERFERAEARVRGGG